MNLSTKSIVSVVLVFATIGLGYFGVWPRWNAYKQAQQTLAINNAQKAKLEQGQAQLNSFLDEYRQHTADAKTLEQALPLSKSKLYEVLNNLDSLGRQGGITLGTLTIRNSQETDTLGAQPGSIQPVDLTIGVTASYAAFRNFVSNLETNLRLIDIQTVSLQNGETPNTMTISLSFRTYYQQ